MDREIPKEVRIKERNKKLVKYGIIGLVSVICIGMLISWMQMIPVCASSSPALHMMYSAYKLNKQGDNIQP